jgi:hypothetical protein
VPNGNQNPAAPPERIQFAPGATSAAVPGSVPAGGMVRYVLGVQGGQFLNASLAAAEGRPSLAIFGADGTVLISPMSGAHGWSGAVPTTQDYFIDVKSDGAAAVYTLNVVIPALNPPTPAEAPTPVAERISFPSGGTSATRSGNLPAQGMQRYVLGLQAGQTMDVTTTASPGEVAVVVFGADGTVLQSPMGTLPSFNGSIPSTQDYIIDIKAGPAPTGYTMTVSVPPLAAPTPGAQRVSFAPGGTSATRSGSLAAGGSARYVLALAAGKRFIVTTMGNPNPVAVSVFGADGNVLQSPMGTLPGFDGTIPSTQDYFVDVINGPAPTAYSVTFTAPAP